MHQLIAISNLNGHPIRLAGCQFSPFSPLKKGIMSVFFTGKRAQLAQPKLSAELYQ
jgi:hypothetical protein